MALTDALHSEMSLEFILAMCSGLLAGVMGVTTVMRSRPTVPHFAFAAGMVILGFESFCSGLVGEAILPDTILFWQTLGMAAMALLPGPWLVFSLTYGRGDYGRFLAKWRFIVWPVFLVPIGLILGFHQQLVAGVVQTGGPWVLRLETPGLALNAIMLLTSV